MLDGSLVIKAFEFKQSQVVFAGTLAAEEVPGMVTGSSGMHSSYLSFKDILCEIEKHFNKPDVIDKIRKDSFVNEAMPNAPPLTEAEEEKMRGVGSLQQALLEKGKRVKGTLKEGIDKYLWTEEGKHWGAFTVTLDRSARGVMAEKLELDSYANSRNHQSSHHHSLPRTVVKNVDGTRSLYYQLGVYFPAFENRIFNNWFTWKEVDLSKTQTAYLIGFGPMSKFELANTSFVDPDSKSFTVGEVLG